MNITPGKTGTTLHTKEEIAAARRNVKRYAWAREEMEAHVKACEPWIARSDEDLWAMVTGQSIPRGIHVNPDLGCPTCGRAVYEKAGNYPWKLNVDRPWKLECPSCGEVWPKNDFGAFYRSGLGPDGVFDRKRADESLLYNAERPDPKDPLHRYAVDDAYGWFDEQGNRWWFIAYYGHYGTWGFIPDALRRLSQAYLLTGERVYAHKAAVLLDRTADVYPDMNLGPYCEQGLYNSDGSSKKGRIVGAIWENGLSGAFSTAYDATYEGMAGDDALVSFLSEKARRHGLRDKSSVDAIRRNIEDGLLREFIKSCHDRRMRGNEGMVQTAMTVAAVVLDHPEETPAALDWVFAPGEREQGGGHVAAVFNGKVDRDGVGDEAAPSYNFGWLRNFERCAEVLARYPKYTKHDFYRDFPRFRQMYRVPYLITALDRYTPHIGDASKTGDPGLISVNLPSALKAFRLFRDPFYAQLAYKLNGNRVEGLRTWVFDEDPEAIQGEIAEVIQRHGELKLGSAHLNGYGLAMFRSGVGDNRRAAWLYYGRTWGHGHWDRLNYGFYYRGMDILPDLDPPEYANSKWPGRAGWTKNTISHNTVVVDRKAQEAGFGGRCLACVDAGGVKMIDVRSPEVYPGVREYRRTFIAVYTSPAESYLVDLFRADGGEDHVLSFHAGEGEVETEGLALREQARGTYAGEDIPFGQHYDGAPDGRYRGSGFSYLYDVARATSPVPGWSVTYRLKDTWGTKVGDGDVRVRYTMLSDVDEAAIAHGDPPRNKPGNPRRLRYVLAHRARPRSLFVSVVEPCGDRRNLKRVDRIDLGLGPEDLTAAAVRVETAEGRVDAILSSDDPARAFDLGDGVRAAGRFVVVSTRDGRLESILAVGGTRVEAAGRALSISKPAYAGRITAMYTGDIGPSWVRVDADLPAGERLTGAMLRVHTNGPRDACYAIRGVSKAADGTTEVGLGDVTFVQGLKDPLNYSKGYVYDFEIGDAWEVLTVVQVTTESGWPAVAATVACEWV